jgi:hypothetical protein
MVLLAYRVIGANFATSENWYSFLIPLQYSFLPVPMQSDNAAKYHVGQSNPSIGPK